MPKKPGIRLPLIRPKLFVLPLVETSSVCVEVQWDSSFFFSYGPKKESFTLPATPQVRGFLRFLEENEGGSPFHQAERAYQEVQELRKDVYEADRRIDKLQKELTEAYATLGRIVQGETVINVERKESQK